MQIKTGANVSAAFCLTNAPVFFLRVMCAVLLAVIACVPLNLIAYFIGVKDAGGLNLFAARS